MFFSLASQRLSASQTALNALVGVSKLLNVHCHAQLILAPFCSRELDRLAAHLSILRTKVGPILWDEASTNKALFSNVVRNPVSVTTDEE